MNDVLREIASAAVRLAAERDRLTKSLDSLRFAVETLEPSASLDDNGNLQTGLLPVVVKVPPAPEPQVVVTPRQARRERAQAQIDQEREAPEPTQKAPEPAPEPKPEPTQADRQPEYPPDTPEQAEKAREEGQTVAMEPTQADRQAKAAGLTKPPRAAANLARSPKPRSQMKGQQREREERMDMIVQYTLDQPNHKSNPVDAAIALRFTRESVSRDYRELEQRGVLRRVGNVHSQYALENLSPKKRGRPTVEYVFVNGHTETPVKAPKPKLKVITEEQVRDAATKLDEFNMFELMHELNAEEHNRSFIVRMLDHFVNRGWFTRTLKGWKHVKPVDPGAAAKYDAENAPRGSGTRQDLAGPVAGTGKADKFGKASKEVRDVLEACERQGANIERTERGHFIVKGKGERLIISPHANRSSLVKSTAMLRRAGYTL